MLKEGTLRAGHQGMWEEGLRAPRLAWWSSGSSQEGDERAWQGRGQQTMALGISSWVFFLVLFWFPTHRKNRSHKCGLCCPHWFGNRVPLGQNHITCIHLVLCCFHTVGWASRDHAAHNAGKTPGLEGEGSWAWPGL